MNVYLLALIALIGAFCVGFVVYGQIFKGPLGTEGAKLEAGHLAFTSVLVYLSALSFIYIFDHLNIGDLSGVAKGVTFGLLTGVGLFVLPLLADVGFFKSTKEAQVAVAMNWALSFVVMGLLVGWLR